MFFRKRKARRSVQTREHERLTYTEACLIQTRTGDYRAQALNISKGGLSIRLRSLGKITPETRVSVLLQNFSPIQAEIRWVKGRTVGVQFLTSVERHAQIRDLIQRLQAGKPARLEVED